MSYTFTTLSGTEQSKLAAGKPIFAALNPLRVTIDPAASGWVASATGTGAGPFVDETGQEYYRAVDGFTGFRTKPNTTANSWTLVFVFNTGIDFDMFGFINHNLWSSNCTSMSLQIADDFTFSTNLITLKTDNPSLWSTQGRRYAFWDIGHTTNYQRYFNVQFVRLILTKGSAWTPEIGQLVLGRRIQMSYNPEADYDPDHLVGVSVIPESETGAFFPYNKIAGRKVFDGQIILTDAFNFAADWKAVFLPQTNWLANPFVYCDDASNSFVEHKFQLMLQESSPDFQAPYFAWQARNITLRAVEQGPFFSESEVAT